MKVICPECGEGYSPQGLYGHLMGHGLGGEELEEVYQEAMESSEEDGEGAREQLSGDLASIDEQSEEVGDEAVEEGEDASIPLSDPPSSPDESGKARREERDRQPSRTSADEVQAAADRLRRAKTRLNTVMDELGVDDLDGDEDRSGGAVTALIREVFGTGEPEGPDLDKAEKECLERCREEVEEARRELRRLLQKRQAEHEYEEA